MFVKPLVLLISNICVVLVSFVVAGPCIQTMVANGEKMQKNEVLFPATVLERTNGRSSALRSNPRPTIERMPRQPTSHALP
jgi:hypothetical protein